MMIPWFLDLSIWVIPLCAFMRLFVLSCWNSSPWIIFTLLLSFPQKVISTLWIQINSCSQFWKVTLTFKIQCTQFRNSSRYLSRLELTLIAHLVSWYFHYVKAANYSPDFKMSLVMTFKTHSPVKAKQLGILVGGL